MAFAMSLSPGIPERAVALTLRSEGLQSRGDAAGAQSAVDEALALAPRFVPGWLQRASLDESAGRRDAAIDAYKQVLDIDANHVIALNNLAYSLAVHRNMPMDALVLARKAVALAPNSPTILDTLAWIQHLLGDNAGAAKIMEQILKTNIFDPDIRLHAAIVFAAAGAPSIAQNQLMIALKLNPALADREDVKTLQTELASKK
jgi:Flp pilus assembly protein TadD